MVESWKRSERKHSDLKLPVINDPDSCKSFPRVNGNLLKEKFKEAEASTDFSGRGKDSRLRFIVCDYCPLSLRVDRQDETHAGTINGHLNLHTPS